jgi:predicted nucleic acid-binding protein
MIGRAVVDASVAIKWIVDEEGSDAALALVGAELWAPALLLAECGSALWRRARLGLLSQGEALERLTALATAPVQLAPDETSSIEALRLALDLDHPIYDCLYLALAHERDLPLITADRRLIGVASRHPMLAGRVRSLLSAAD